MFAGPPPPIASSMLVKKGGHKPTERNHTNGHDQSKQTGLGSLLFDYNHSKQSTYQPHSVWRGIRRREKALEDEVQQFLDLQATGLVAGSNGLGPLGSDADGYSDTGSSTPTGTFYSTATSKSRMVNSLYVPTRATPDGSVIPVRQPKSNKPRGLRFARTGLRRTISSLTQLKAEEDAHVDEALVARRKALNQLERLKMRQDSVSTELKALEDDSEEPLGQELRELGSRYDSVSEEIRELEEKLKALRNQRRWLRDTMEEVKNRREAGLSGYRGALKDVDSEVTALMHRPPIQPLDLEALQPGGRGKTSPTGGLEFMRLIPERRTLEMAKAWWEAEVTVLEQRKAKIEEDRQALEEGGAVWTEVMRLVSDYESRLRQLMKGEMPETSPKGKDKVPSQDEVIRSQLPEMEKIAEDLERHMHHAEDNHWNLLICAIGAELEAFSGAIDMLKSALADDEGDTHLSPQSAETAGQPHLDNHSEVSDNEVPADLLVSRHDEPASHDTSMASPEVGPTLRKVESENEVPPEFLAEHKDEVD